MSERTVAIMSAGAMGSAIGAVLLQGGYRVITSLEGRSGRTAALAEEAGLELVGSDAELVREAGILLSVLAPAGAVPLAERIAAAVCSTGTDLLYADLNAVAPQTVRSIASIVTTSGARFVDGGIMGDPPEKGRAQPAIVLSGEDAAEIAALGDAGLQFRILN